MEPVYTPVIGAALLMFRTMAWDVRATGVEHIPAVGGGVVATNHIGYLDFTFVGAGVLQRDKRLLRFLAKKEVFDHRIAGPLMRGMKHIPVDRFGGGGGAYGAAVDALRRGELVGMFPEATISRSFVPMAGKVGAARMAMAAGVPLIPGAVWGSQRIMTKGRKPNWQRRVVVTVDFGEPVAYEADDDPGQVTKRLMTAISGLVDTAMQRYPQRPAGADDRWWLPAHAGGTAPTLEAAERIAADEAQGRGRPHSV